MTRKAVLSPRSNSVGNMDNSENSKEVGVRGIDIRMTQVEEFEDIRATRVFNAELPEPGTNERLTAPIPSSELRRFRPTVRPPMAVLCVNDDNQTSGRMIRIYDPEFVIGRTDGNLAIPHDLQISSRHAQLERRHEGQGFAWYLRDLGSTNGTFVRAHRAVLTTGNELILGSARYRFDALPGDASPTAELVQIMVDGPDVRIALRGPRQWLGRDPGLRIPSLHEDCLLSERHAELERGDDGRWAITDAASLNGVWIRVLDVRLTKNCSFQLGEQRFSFFLP